MKIKTKLLTRVIATAVLFVLCVNPICHAADNNNVSAGLDGELISEPENTDSENTSSPNTHGLNEYIERAKEIIDWLYEDSLEYEMSAFTATDMAEEVAGVQTYMVPEGITTTRVKIPWYNNNYIIFDIRKTFDDNYFCSEFNSENKYVGMVLFRNNSLIECLVNSDKTCSVKTFGFFPDDLFDEQADVPFFLFDKNKKLLMYRFDGKTKVLDNTVVKNPDYIINFTKSLKKLEETLQEQLGNE